MRTDPPPAAASRRLLLEHLLTGALLWAVAAGVLCAAFKFAPEPITVVNWILAGGVVGAAVALAGRAVSALMRPGAALVIAGFALGMTAGIVIGANDAAFVRTVYTPFSFVVVPADELSIAGATAGAFAGGVCGALLGALQATLTTWRPWRREAGPRP